jgi:hypothetical protein
LFCAGCLLAQDLREAPAGPTMATVCTFHGDTCFATARKVEGQCSRCQTCGQVVKKNYMCQSCFEQMSQWPICPIHRLRPQTRAGSPERAARQPTPPGLDSLAPRVRRAGHRLMPRVQRRRRRRRLRPRRLQHRPLRRWSAFCARSGRHRRRRCRVIRLLRPRRRHLVHPLRTWVRQRRCRTCGVRSSASCNA